MVSFIKLLHFLIQGFGDNTFLAGVLALVGALSVRNAHISDKFRKLMEELYSFDKPQASQPKGPVRLPLLPPAAKVDPPDQSVIDFLKNPQNNILEKRRIAFNAQSDIFRERYEFTANAIIHAIRAFWAFTIAKVFVAGIHILPNKHQMGLTKSFVILLASFCICVGFCFLGICFRNLHKEFLDGRRTVRIHQEFLNSWWET